MTFFYDLNKKLDSIREKPETTHKQLNERDEGKPGKNFAKIAKDAEERYGSKAAGERVAGAVRAKLAKQGKLEEEGMSRAAKGYEKYGKQGMEALAKAGREGKALDPVRKKYDKYDEGIEDRIGDLDMTNPVNQPAYQRKAAAQGGAAPATKSAVGKRHEGFPRFSGGQKPADMPKSHEGFPRLSGDAVKETGGKPMTAKQKSFAKLAPPADKITFADKIAGAKKEVDEMLGDVAANAMKKAVAGRQETDEGWDDMIKDVDRRRMMMKKGEKVQGHKGEIEKTDTGIRHTRRYDAKTGETDVGDEAGDAPKRGRGRPKGTGKSMGAKGPSGKSKLMTKEAGDPAEKGEYDYEGDMALDDIDTIQSAAQELQSIIDTDENLPEWVQSKINKAMDYLDTARDYMSAQGNDEQPVNEKAVSKKQQRFMGMVHAAQKGEKPASKKVAKVAKSMGKKDAEDFAATKHAGLPEKAPKKDNSSDKADKKSKKEKTEEAGGAGTPTASSGFSFGKGIYDSINRELEGMIAEGMNISMNMTNDQHGGPSKSLTVTATEEDATKLAEILKMAGLGGGSGSGCGCGSTPCSCDQMDEAYGDTTPTENAPDYPTNTETSDDALQYAGGLNKPKSTGQTTVPVIASQEERQESYADVEEDAIRRMMEMAGIKKKEVEEEKTEEGNLFTGNLAKARAAGKKEADLDGDGDMEKVRESIFTLTNQWKAYKG